MTKRLYLEDPYVTAFDADVVETRETEDGPAVVFTETHFYPESGGQPFDLGTIDGVPVTKVVETDDKTVLHILERLPGSTRVHCEIDENRRRDHMQQHSGQHILSAAFVRELDTNTTSFHLGAQISTIDLDRRPLTRDDVARAERAANDVARRGVAIKSIFVTGDEARSLELRKPPPEGESLRIVEVAGFDHQACCGTHPRSSSEVSPIVVRGFEKFKDGTRVEFVCGDRALADYHESVSRVRALASVLSSSEADLVDTATKLQAERKSMSKELAKLKSRALLADAESWMAKAAEIGEWRVLIDHVEALGPGEMRVLAQKLVEKPSRIVLLGAVDDGRAHLVFARSKDTDADMNALLRAALGVVAGRGGGSAEIAQGGGPNTAGIDDALAAAKRLLVP